MACDRVTIQPGGDIYLNYASGVSAVEVLTHEVGLHSANENSFISVTDNAGIVVVSDIGMTVTGPLTAALIPPLTDPQIAGSIWNNHGVLTISAG